MYKQFKLQVPSNYTILKELLQHATALPRGDKLQTLSIKMVKMLNIPFA